MTAMARPRGAQTRALTPSSSCSRSCIPTSSASSTTRTPTSCSSRRSCRRSRTDERVNMVTPALFARYPTPRGLAARRPGRRRGDRPLDRLLPEQDEEPDRHGAGARRALRRRGARRARRPRHAPGRRPQDRQRRPSVWFDEPGLPVDTHVDRLSRRLEAHRRDRPGEDRARPQRDGPARGVGRVLPPADPARPPGVLRRDARAATRACSPASARRRARSAPARRRPRSERRRSVPRRRHPSSSADGPLEGAAGGGEGALGREELARDRGVGRLAVALGDLGDAAARARRPGRRCSRASAQVARSAASCGSVPHGRRARNRAARDGPTGTIGRSDARSSRPPRRSRRPPRAAARRRPTARRRRRPCGAPRSSPTCGPRGDAAVRELTARFDGVEVDELRVGRRADRSAALDARRADAARRARARPRPDRRVARGPARARAVSHERDGVEVRELVVPGRPGRLLRARRPRAATRRRC